MIQQYPECILLVLPGGLQDEITVHIPVPRDIRSRDLRVDVKEKRIKVLV